MSPRAFLPRNRLGTDHPHRRPICLEHSRIPSSPIPAPIVQRFPNSLPLMICGFVLPVHFHLPKWGICIFAAPWKRADTTSNAFDKASTCTQYVRGEIASCKPQETHVLVWRRGGDSNPRHPFGVKLISSQPCSATPAPLRGKSSRDCGTSAGLTQESITPSVARKLPLP